MSDSPASASHKSSPRKWRLWIPLTVVIVATVFIVWLHWIEHTYKTHGLQFFSVAGGILIVVWFIFLSGQSARAKKALLAAFALFCVLVAASFATGFLRLEPDGSGWFMLRVGPNKSLAPLEVPETAPKAKAENSPFKSRFLGENGDGVIAGPPLVTDWEKNPPRTVWRIPIGQGWSSFAVAKGRAITMEQREETELTVCYDLNTGDPLWANKNAARFEESMGGIGPRATPTVFDGKVFSFGATGILKCLELETGDLIWEHDVLKEFDSGNVDWGQSASPLISGDNVVVSSGKGGPTLVAFNRADGKLAWKSGNRTTSYASPVLATLHGQEQILSVNAQSLTGHDPQTGEELWAFDWDGAYPKVGQPIAIDGDKVLVTASYSMGSFLVKISKQGDEWSAEELWETSRLKTKFSSAVVLGDHAYGLSEGRITCISLADGKEVWRETKYGYGQNILIGDTLLIQAERGDVVLVAADPASHSELARIPALKGKSWAAPALAGDYLLVRNAEEAACYLLKREQGGSAAE